MGSGSARNGYRLRTPCSNCLHCTQEYCKHRRDTTRVQQVVANTIHACNCLFGVKTLSTMTRASARQLLITGHWSQVTEGLSAAETICTKRWWRCICSKGGQGGSKDGSPHWPPYHAFTAASPVAVVADSAASSSAAPGRKGAPSCSSHAVCLAPSSATVIVPWAGLQGLGRGAPYGGPMHERMACPPDQVMTQPAPLGQCAASRPS